MKRQTTTLTPQELEIMKIVWDKGEATVRDVYETLLEHRRIAYTTVMTMMGVLESKGHLKKRLEDRAYAYRPTRSKSVVLGSMVREFVDRVFNGATAPLLVHLAKDKRIDEEQLEELRQLLREKEEEKK
jgi:BlaI family transcriptional regulator, penicillinase repressor